MFCFKCGAELPEGSAFCPKCGAMLTSGENSAEAGADSGQTSVERKQTAAETPVSVPAANVKTKKKKNIILWVILGLLVVFIVYCVVNSDELAEQGKEVQLGETSAETETSEQSAEINLSETYTNAEEGFSIKYPSDWTVSDVPDNLVYLSSQKKAFMGMEKYDADDTILTKSKEDFEALYAHDLENVQVTDLSECEIDGCRARRVKITFIQDNKELFGLQYLFNNGDFSYLISFSCSQNNAKNYEPVFDAIIDSLTFVRETVSDSSPSPAVTSADTFNAESSGDWREAYVEKVNEINNEAGKNSVSFDLIDLNGDEVPELYAVYYDADYNKHEFLYIRSEDYSIHELINETSCSGSWKTYSYYPGQNVVCCELSEGGDTFIFYQKMDSSYSLVNIYDEPIKYDGSSSHYYYGDTEISEMQYREFDKWGTKEWQFGLADNSQILFWLEHSAAAKNVSEAEDAEGWRNAYAEKIKNTEAEYGMYDKGFNLIDIEAMMYRSCLYK